MPHTHTETKVKKIIATLCNCSMKTSSNKKSSDSCSILGASATCHVSAPTPIS